MQRAYVISSAMSEPDPEMELAPGEEPSFGNHSSRRFSDRVAQESKKELDILPETIDYFFGWRLEAMSKVMQLHYAGLDMGARLVLAWCTAKI